MKNLIHSIAFIFLISLFSVVDVWGQNASNNDLKEIKYEKGLSGAGLIHTRGWGLTVRYLQNVSVKKNRIYELNFLGALKHPKEVKSINPTNDNARPYVYGKLNHLMVMKLGYGNQHIIADREQVLGLKIFFNYMVGPNVGILKPMYLEIIKDNPDGPTIKVIEKYDPKVHTDQSRIFGGAPFLSNGFDELKFIPGASAKASLGFDWGNSDNEIKVLETGIMVDAFPREVPIFAYIKNKYVFINMFVSLSFGSWW